MKFNIYFYYDLSNKWQSLLKTRDFGTNRNMDILYHIKVVEEISKYSLYSQY